jgi:hypothetical protein
MDHRGDFGVAGDVSEVIGFVGVALAAELYADHYQRHVGGIEVRAKEGVDHAGSAAVVVRRVAVVGLSRPVD